MKDLKFNPFSTSVLQKNSYSELTRTLNTFHTKPVFTQCRPKVELQSDYTDRERLFNKMGALNTHKGICVAYEKKHYAMGNFTTKNFSSPYIENIKLIHHPMAETWEKKVNANILLQLFPINANMYSHSHFDLIYSKQFETFFYSRVQNLNAMSDIDISNLLTEFSLQYYGNSHMNSHTNQSIKDF